MPNIDDPPSFDAKSLSISAGGRNIEMDARLIKVARGLSDIEIDVSEIVNSFAEVDLDRRRSSDARGEQRDPSSSGGLQHRATTDDSV